MAKTLKEKNRPQLIAFVIVNAISFGILLQGLDREVSFLDSLTKGNIAILGRLVAIPAALALVIGVLGWAVPKSWKETMIFWRIHDCLPSSRAFSDIALRDPRINLGRLVAKHGELPSAAARQTGLWYSMYRKNADEPSVEDAHAAYLRYREMTTLAASVMICFSAASVWVHPSARTISIGIAAILAEYLLLLFAARHAASHFVANVLAIESASEWQPTQA
jgi:hypothetical protein